MSELLTKYFNPIAIIISIIFFTMFLSIELNKKIWLDELDSIIQVKVDSVEELISNYYQGADTHPPLYFILLWATNRMFWDSVLAYRMLSVVFAILGFIIFSLILKEIINKNSVLWGGMIAVSSAYFINFLISEIRPYSLYFLTTLLLLYLRLLLYKKNSYFFYTLYTGSLILFLFSHYYASIYFILLCFLETFFILKKKSDWLTILPYIISGTAFLIWIPAIINQFNSFGQITYHSFPGILKYLLLPFDFFRYFSVAILLFAIFSFFYKNKELTKINHIFWSINLMFILAPLFIYFISFIRNPVFSDRYFIPTFVGYLILGTIGLTQILNKFNNIKLWYLFLLFFLVYNSQRYYKVINSYQNQDSLIEKNLSLLNSSIIVCESPHTFTPLYFYSTEIKKANVYLVFSKKANLLGANISQNLFDYLWFKKKKYSGQLRNIYDWDEFKTKADSFYLINQQDRMLYETEIRNSDDFESVILRDSLILVKKKSD